MLFNLWLIVFLLWTLSLIKFLFEKGQNTRTMQIVIGLAMLGYVLLILHLIL